MNAFFYQLAESLSLQWLVNIWWGFQPVLEILHYSGHILLFGCILLLDLRLMGLGSSVPIERLYRICVPCSGFGLLLAVLSGLVLFLVNIDDFWGNPMLEIKLIFIVAAMVNLGVFHLLFSSRISIWDEGQPVPAMARWLALCSCILWVVVIVFGRLIAYF